MLHGRENLNICSKIKVDSLYTKEGMERLAKIVEEARGENSLRRFSEMTEVSVNVLSALEKGEKKNPDPLTIKKIARFTRYSFEQLMAIATQTPESLAIEGERFRTAGDLWAIVQMLPKEEKAKLCKMLVDYFISGEN